MDKTLTKAEEEIMHYIWEYQPCSVKDIMAKMSEPKPAYNTVSTIVRILERKEFVYHQAKGRGYVYLSKVDKASYSKTSLDKLLGGYFQGSMKSMGVGKLIDVLFGEKCEHHYIQPTFITDYPKEMSPLTKEHRDNPDLTERFELMVNGKELANAYSVLNDPIDQKERFEDQLKLSEKGDDEAMFIDGDFVRALEYGMPPTSGIGIGIDRLVMFMTNNASIQEVLFFPQMKPEKKAIPMTEEEKAVMQILKSSEEGQMTLTDLKQASSLSNKKWDKTIKGLKKHGVLEVVKQDDVLQVILN